MAKILVLEDHLEVADMLKDYLEDADYTVMIESDPAKALASFWLFQPDLITLDVSFSEQVDETGIELLQRIRQDYPADRLPVLVISAQVNADKLTRLSQLGIDGYLGKPVNRGELLKKVRNYLEKAGSLDQQSRPWLPQMRGKSPAILELILKIDKAAKAESDLLITGETGVGKEQVVMKYLELSPRKNRPFIPIDCGTIQPNLFESEIFGHEANSFTNAKLKIGKIEEANQGIVFLDEIGNLPLEQQQKLLRLLQTKTFMRVGGTRLIKADVVILAATNKDLHEKMTKGTFLNDLYYRLKYINVEMPPLREHLEDLEELTADFIQEANHKYKKHVLSVEPEVIKRFRQMPWLGNVRDLENCILHGVIRCEGATLRWQDVAEDCKPEILPAAGQSLPDDYLQLAYREFKKYLEQDQGEKERKYYLHQLEKHNFNIQKTAQAIGVARTYLNSIMKRLMISKPE